MKFQQHLENALGDWARISKLDFTLLDDNGEVIAQTKERRLPSREKLSSFREANILCLSSSTYSLYKLPELKEKDLILVIFGKHDSLSTLGELAVCQIQSLYTAYAEKNDKQTFLQNLLLGNYSEAEILSRSRQLHLPDTGRRAVFLIEPKHSSGNAALSTIRNIFSARTRDFVFPMGDTSIIITRELLSTENENSLNQTAHMLVDMLGAEAMISAQVSYSRPADSLSQLPLAYRQAKTAMDVGKLFYAHSPVFGYENLGIGRLIYHLPPEICELFVNEIFGEEGPEGIDEETLSTVRTLFENNLNLSETARQLYVHRNTLVYRFEKLQKKLDLDVRTFEDAVTFKLAMMVVDYIKARAGRFQ